MGELSNLTAADGHTLSAYVAGPEDAAVGLVVVQEIFGVNQYTRSMCDRFAAQGYLAVAPALFDRVERDVELGYDSAGIERGRAILSKLREPDVLADVAAAAHRLGGGKKIGVVGYCFGGAAAWWGATRTDLFAAASSWYGGGITWSRDAQPHCPVQMHFGEKDAAIPLTDVEAIRAAQPKAEIYVYPGAGHGFGCDQRQSYDQASYELAQRRTLAFFAQHLSRQ